MPTNKSTSKAAKPPRSKTGPSPPAEVAKGGLGVTAAPQPAAAPEPAATGTQGTERWPKATVKSGHYIQLPKVLVKRFKEFRIEPRHLWLLLMLQVDRYRNRPPRFYWEELADACGKDKDTVRKWGYELERMGLIRIRRMRKFDDGIDPGPGMRNERNQFMLEPFEERVAQVHAHDEQERAARRSPKNRPQKK